MITSILFITVSFLFNSSHTVLFQVLGDKFHHFGLHTCMLIPQGEAAKVNSACC